MAAIGPPGRRPAAAHRGPHELEQITILLPAVHGALQRVQAMLRLRPVSGGHCPANGDTSVPFHDLRRLLPGISRSPPWSAVQHAERDNRS
jgi:hypothetical protein